MTKIIAIAAVDENWGIGQNNAIPWKLPKDLELFKEETYNNTLIMGRVTYESIPKPLVNRNIIVLTKNPKWQLQLPHNVMVSKSMEHAIKLATTFWDAQKIYIAGGSDIYKLAFDKHLLDEAIISHINGKYSCNRFFPLVFPKLIADGEWQITRYEDYSKYGFVRKFYKKI